MLLLSLRKEQSISFAGSLQYTDPKRIFFALLVFRMVQKNGPARVKRRMQWEAPSKPLAVDDPLLLPERKVHAEIGINWFLDREIPKGGYVTTLAESLL